ncbi:uncharacterized protein FIBRA_06235 [Fibroporia radiculosa]|uniref:DUF829 domain-containing protein n=1 Tax=Fibroporia radiculosa TaxID=599839 RepID=J4IB56_9APHY|nr:uncharacterized protein FIBRA_06235 [Fibroporia radiculosa]CCM04076.1 predicted protein [Fibroporia radiculosa]
MSAPSSSQRELTFVELSPQVLLFAREGKSIDWRHPSVIILFGWMDARVAHLMKYAEHLRAAFGTSTLVVVRSTSRYYFTPQSQLEAALVPVAEAIQKEIADSAQFRGVLVHVLSNGGGFEFMTLRKVLAKMRPPLSLPGDACSSSPPAPAALVLDSVPGDDGLASALRALAPAHPVLRALAVPVIALIYGAWAATNALLGHAPLFAELRAALSGVVLLPAVPGPAAGGQAAPRLYVYSDADRIVRGADVARHAREAEDAGFDVAVERLATSAHVAHMRNDPERYWAAVRRVWARAVERSGMRAVSAAR